MVLVVVLESLSSFALRGPRRRLIIARTSECWHLMWTDGLGCSQTTKIRLDHIHRPEMILFLARLPPSPRVVALEAEGKFWSEM